MTDTTTVQALAFDRLQKAVAEDAAVRFCAELQPAGGRGDKVFPPTYAGGQYALESRVDDHGVVREVVLLDSVQSQANRMEQALLAAHRADRITLPMVSVRFSTIEQLKELGDITVLDAPHRLADAILRDSMLNGALFPATPEGQVLRRSTPNNATELFKLCPTSLLFGIWESTGAAGGSGVKFQRAIVSEIVGIGAVVGRRTASRIDPLQIARIPIYEVRDDHNSGIRWTADESKAATEGGKPKPYKLDAQGRVKETAKGVPSELNHGNVTPDVSRHRGKTLPLGRGAGEQAIVRDRDGRIVRDRGERFLRERDELPGGVTFDLARHTAVLSLAALRKLHFPLDGNAEASTEARLVLAALGLFALTELRRDGYDLRSRCALAIDGKPKLEIVKRDGTTDPFVLDEAGAKVLLDAALDRAKVGRLVWRPKPVELEPSPALVDLVLKSRAAETIEADGDEDAEEEEPSQERDSED